MTDWCENNMTVKFKSKEKLEEFVRKARVEREVDDEAKTEVLPESFSMLKLVPMDPEVKALHHSFHHDWMVENLGTKWDAMNTSVSDPYQHNDLWAVDIYFMCPWNMPKGFFYRVAAQYDVEIEVESKTEGARKKEKLKIDSFGLECLKPGIEPYRVEKLMKAMKNREFLALNESLSDSAYRRLFKLGNASCISNLLKNRSVPEDVLAEYVRSGMANDSSNVIHVRPTVSELNDYNIGELCKYQSDRHGIFQCILELFEAEDHTGNQYHILLSMSNSRHINDKMVEWICTETLQRSNNYEVYRVLLENMSLSEKSVRLVYNQVLRHFNIHGTYHIYSDRTTHLRHPNCPVDVLVDSINTDSIGVDRMDKNVIELIMRHENATQEVKTLCEIRQSLA
jgi:hypothetical protein